MIRHHVIDRFLDALYFAALDPFLDRAWACFCIMSNFYEFFSSKHFYIYTDVLYFYFWFSPMKTMCIYNMCLFDYLMFEHNFTELNANLVYH